MQHNTQDNQTTTRTVEFEGHTFSVAVPVIAQGVVSGEGSSGAAGSRPGPPCGCAAPAAPEVPDVFFVTCLFY